ncbi:MAG: hypothetical protein ACRDZX_06000 [Acidimicrobiales bacterium]
MNWSAIVAAMACFVAGGYLAGQGLTWPAVGVVAGGLLVVSVMVSAHGGTTRLGQRDRHLLSPEPRRPRRLAGAALRRFAGRQRPHPGDPDLYLDLDAVEVNAVYVLGPELFTQLKGGIGQRRDPVTGDQRNIETSDVSLTWRCGGRRSATRLAQQLNQWEARGTLLRLLAARGRCALLMEDDHHWVVLPELRLAA